MLVKESYWYKDVIANYVSTGSHIIIIGSSTRTFREKLQPHIYENVYKPLESLKCSVLNVDLKEDEGVDLAGDITDVVFLNQLKNLKADFVICSNLLEHITNRAVFINSISAILKEGGKLIISVPFSYPYHSDPIDTLYRPSVKQLVNDLKDFSLLEGKIVKSGKLFKAWYREHSHFKGFSLFFFDCIRALLKFNRKKLNLSRWFFVDIAVTCCILEKSKYRD
jgi:SAM-dependent methyltransferase